MNENCISYWLPKVQASGVPYPETYLIGVGTSIESIENFSFEPTVSVEQLMNQVAWACEAVGYPAFLRGGLGSGKHDWNRCCQVNSEEEIRHKIYFTLYDQLCKDLDMNMIAIRKMIATKKIFTAFNGFPVTREFRLFVKGVTEAPATEGNPIFLAINNSALRIVDADVYHIQPYWPANAIENHCYEDGWQEKLKEISVITDEEMSHLQELASAVIRQFSFCHDDWSMDFLQDVDGKWWLTDMAIASASYKYTVDEEGVVEE